MRVAYWLLSELMASNLAFLAFSLAPSLDRVKNTPAAPTITMPPIHVRAIIVGEPADWTSSSKPFWPPLLFEEAWANRVAFVGGCVTATVGAGTGEAVVGIDEGAGVASASTHVCVGHVSPSSASC